MLTLIIHGMQVKGASAFLRSIQLLLAVDLFRYSASVTCNECIKSVKYFKDIKSIKHLKSFMKNLHINSYISERKPCIFKWAPINQSINQS